MKSIFIDCNDQLDQVWAKVIRTDDPKIDVNTAPFKREELPLVLAGLQEGDEVILYPGDRVHDGQRVLPLKV